MSFLDILQLEEVEMVFAHLPIDGLLELTLICPKANKIISNSTHLMQKFRFKIQGHYVKEASKKYSQIDFRKRNYRFKFQQERGTRQPTRKYSNLDFFKSKLCFCCRKLQLEDLLASVTKVTLTDCGFEVKRFHKFLSETSGTLELLIIDDCLFFKNCKYFVISDADIAKLKPVQLPKLRTLILVNFYSKPRFTVLSIMKATNLIELGIINREPKMQDHDAQLFIDLIASNRKLKILNVPEIVPKTFLDFTLKYPDFEFHLEELSLEFYDTLKFDESIMNFLESQKSTLKSLRLVWCKIGEEYSERLLSLNLVELEFSYGSIELSPDTLVCNSSIQNLTFEFGNYAKSETIRNFVKSCKNLSACVATTSLKTDELLPGTEMSRKYFDIRSFLPERIRFANHRQLQFAGAVLFTNHINCSPMPQRFHFYYDESKEKSFERHPYSIIKMKKNNYQ